MVLPFLLKEKFMSAEMIVKDLKKHYTKGKTLLVGIDGLGGAGKSTVADEVSRLLEAEGINTEVFHVDDFIHPKAVRYNDDYPQWEQYYYLQWRYDYFLSAVVKPLRESMEVPPVELYDKDNDSYITDMRSITNGSIVITEGIFLQREELKGAFDYMIYVDVSEKERLSRVLLRDGYIGDETDIRRKYEERYFPAERFYAEKYRPTENADLVI